MTKKKQHKDLQTTWKTISTIVSVAIAIFCAGFWAGWYIHGNISSVEFHEKEMQLYNLHRQIDEGYKDEIRQLEAEKRTFEKEIYELRKESLKKK